MEKKEVIINRQLFEEIGVSVEEIAKLAEEGQKNSNVNCLLFHKLKRKGKFTCPWPLRCAHKQ